MSSRYAAPPQRLVDGAVPGADMPHVKALKLTFAAHVPGCIAWNGPLRRGEGSNAQPRLHTAFDPPVILSSLVI